MLNKTTASNKSETTLLYHFEPISKAHSGSYSCRVITYGYTSERNVQFKVLCEYNCVCCLRFYWSLIPIIVLPKCEILGVMLIVNELYWGTNGAAFHYNYMLLACAFSL